MRNWFLLLLMLAGQSQAQILEPVDEVCSLDNGVEVRIVGQNADLIEIHDVINGRFYPAYNESREEMGGRSGFHELHCSSDVYQSGGLILIRTGHNNDYAHMYGVERRSDGSLVFHQLRVLLGDAAIDVQTGFSGGLNSVSLRMGHNRDRYHRYCWDGLRWYKAMPEGFTGGWADCNREFPDFVRVVKPQHTRVSLPSDRAPADGLPPVTTPEVVSGIKVFCTSGPPNNFTGSVELFETGATCREAGIKVNTQMEGACQRLGNRYRFTRVEPISTATCRQ